MVKARVVEQASQQGASFNERELGFKNFIEFVRTVPEIAIQQRPGSDMILAPKGAEETLSAYAHRLPRVRRDFFRAFIEFPVPDTCRIYDPVQDKVIYEPAGGKRNGIPIEPIKKDTQVEWRREFAAEQPDEVNTVLTAALGSPHGSPFTEFARRLREHPLVARSWNRYLQKRITDCVASWADANKVSSDLWQVAADDFLAGSPTTGTDLRPRGTSQRTELYNFFDSLPLEDLLKLRVPLELVLKAAREKR